MIKNILFDLDGTIIDSEPGISAGITYALEQNGYKVPDRAVIRTCIGPPLTESFSTRLGADPADVMKLIGTFRSIYDEKVMFNCALYDGVIEALEFFRNRGYSIGLASTKNESACRKILEHFDIEKYFDSITGSSEDCKRETKTEVIEEHFRRHPWQERSETILIGDTKYDAEGCVLSNITCLGITYGFGTREVLFEYGAKEVFDNLEEVCAYVAENKN